MQALVILAYCLFLNSALHYKLNYSELKLGHHKHTWASRQSGRSHRKVEIKCHCPFLGRGFSVRVAVGIGWVRWGTEARVGLR